MNDNIRDFRGLEVRQIFTHVRADIDALYSSWFAQRFLVKGPSKVIFVPAGWDGKEMRDCDLAVDIHAGGRGVKGRTDRNGNVHSCFSLLLESADPEVRDPLSRIAYFIDKHDAYGRIDDHQPINGDKSNRTGKSAYVSSVFLLKALKASLVDDDKIYDFFSVFLDGLFEMNVQGKNRISRIAKNIVNFGKVALILDSPDESVGAVIFKKLGYWAYVYASGKNLGISVSKKLQYMGFKIDNPTILELLRKSGEEIGDKFDKDWFLHDRGNLLSWGTNKSPASKSSKVNPSDLAVALRSSIVIFEEEERRARPKTVIKKR